MTGDTVLARNMHYIYREKGPAYPLSSIASLIQSADIAATNLETVITSSGDMFPKDGRNPFYFKGRPFLLNILTTTGFDYVATGNNHSMDYGGEALQQQLSILASCGIASSGSGKNIEEAMRPAYFKVDDITIAIVSAFFGRDNIGATKSKTGVFRIRRDSRAFEKIRPVYRQARQHADLVVFTPHWGQNFTKNPTRSHRRLAKQLIDLGFDAIVGHSAHQIHGMEVYKGRPILYDVGNFLADWVRGDRTRHSGLFFLEFNRQGFTKARFHPIWLEVGSVKQSTGEKARAGRNLFRQLSEDIAPDIQFKSSNQELYVLLNPQSNHSVRQPLQPNEVHQPGQTRDVPRHFHDILDSTILEHEPAYTHRSSAIKLEKGVTYLGAQTVETAHHRSGFVVEVAFSIQEKLSGSWEGVVRGKRRGESFLFVDRHPVSNGGSDAHDWEPGQIIIDRICVRRRRDRPPGVYDLYWTLRNRKTRRAIRRLDPFPDKRASYVKIGTIELQSENVSSRASGIDWDGKLPQSKTTRDTRKNKGTKSNSSEKTSP